MIIDTSRNLGVDPEGKKSPSPHEPEPGLEKKQPPPTLISLDEIRRRISHKRWDMSTGEAISFSPSGGPSSSLKSLEDTDLWAAQIEVYLKECEIPIAQWSDGAILFLEGDVNMTMRGLRHRRQEAGLKVWEWADFKGALSEVVVNQDTRNYFQKVKEEYPVATTVAGTSLAVAGGVVLGPALVVGGLNAVGFTTSGVAAGSIAAGLQSSVYGGLTTGLFSVCQSIGAAAAVGPAVSIVSGLAAGAAGLLGSRGAQEESDEGGDAADNPPPYSSLGPSQ